MTKTPERRPPTATPCPECGEYCLETERTCPKCDYPTPPAPQNAPQAGADGLNPHDPCVCLSCGAERDREDMWAWQANPAFLCCCEGCFLAEVNARIEADAEALKKKDLEIAVILNRAFPCNMIQQFHDDIAARAATIQEQDRAIAAQLETITHLEDVVDKLRKENERAAQVIVDRVIENTAQRQQIEEARTYATHKDLCGKWNSASNCCTCGLDEWRERTAPADKADKDPAPLKDAGEPQNVTADQEDGDGDTTIH